MDRYLERTLSGEQGKLICHGCGRLMPVLIKLEKMFVCDLCEKKLEEDDGT
jgi:hypothetical protein